MELWQHGSAQAFVTLTWCPVHLQFGHPARPQQSLREPWNHFERLSACSATPEILASLMKLPASLQASSPPKKNTLPVLAYASTWVAFTVAFQHDAAGSVPGDRRGKQRSRKNLTVQALPRRELEMEEIPFFFETSSRVLHVVWKHQLSWASRIDILGCRRGYGLRSRCPECRVEGGTSLTKDRRFLTPRKSASSFVWAAHSMSGALDRGMKSLQAVQRLSTCSGGAEVRQKGWGRGWQDHWTCDLQAH